MIESANNERVKNYAKLNEKKYREAAGEFLIEGDHLVREALKKGIVKEVFLHKNEENNYGKVTLVNDEVLKKLSSLVTPPKVIAICEKIPSVDYHGNIILLDDIADPGNLGTIIRSAVAFNYETVILSPNTVDIYNPKVIRATEGMLFNVNIIISDLKTVLTSLKEDGYIIFGSDVADGKDPDACPDKHAILIGSEASGVKSEYKIYTTDLNIRMNPKCESLNAGVAASILMYELNRLL